MKTIKFLPTNDFSHEGNLEYEQIETVVAAEESKEEASAPEPVPTSDK